MQRTTAYSVRGFTMTELMVTLACAAILTTMAAPSFNSFIAAQRNKALASELYAALAKTRSEALLLNRNVTLTASAGGWSSGWQIPDPGNPASPIENHGPAFGNLAVTGPATVTYTPSGRMPAGSAAPMFVISATTVSNASPMCVSIDLGGRPYMKGASTC